MIIVVMGVTGAGKTTVGKALAAEMHWRFSDADDYHSPANLAKMQEGIPLTDADRRPWLASLRHAITEWLTAGENVVLACSALKTAYRDMLSVSPEVKIAYLKATPQLVAERLTHRPGHYMNPTLVNSQFETLEEPHGVAEIDADQTVPAIVGQIRTALRI